ncbi:MAG TPA: TadE family protein [Blastocatellia bacterium]|nr:TadE family protein [Blastocatellia bacterium]
MKPALKKRATRQPEGDDRGAVVVEFALILPFLVVLFVAIIDLGLLIREHQVVQNAAREGARFSSLPQNFVDSTNPSATADAIAARVSDYLTQEGITINAGGCTSSPDPNDSTKLQWTCGDVTIRQWYPITMPGGIRAYGSEIKVTYNRSLLVPGAPFLSAGDVTLSGRSVFRNLYGQ